MNCYFKVIAVRLSYHPILASLLQMLTYFYLYKLWNHFPSWKIHRSYKANKKFSSWINSKVEPITSQIFHSLFVSEYWIAELAFLPSKLFYNSNCQPVCLSVRYWTCETLIYRQLYKIGVWFFVWIFMKFMRIFSINI